MGVRNLVKKVQEAHVQGLVLLQHIVFGSAVFAVAMLSVRRRHGWNLAQGPTTARVSRK